MASSAVNDLLGHYWVDDSFGGHILNTNHGLELKRGQPLSLWERATLISVMENQYQSTKDPALRQKLASDWKYVKQVLFTAKERQSCGEGTPSPASDDMGFALVMFLNIHRATKDAEALRDAEALFNNGFKRWAIGKDGADGLSFTDTRRNHRSSVNVAFIWSGIRLYEVTAKREYLERSLALYEWNEKRLLRDDGLYWCIYLENGPERNAVPPSEGVTDTFLAGNMGMGVIHARLYQITGKKLYQERALRTADAIYAHETDGQGHYLDDRDAWANGYFMGEWARVVLTLPGSAPRHKELMEKTARAIYTRDRSARGYYGGCWNGPVEGEGCAWLRHINEPTKPEQLMTSSSAANVIVAAAWLEKSGR